MFYLRIKAEMEQALYPGSASPRSTSCSRGRCYGWRRKVRPLELLAAAVMPLINPLLVGSQSAKRAISARDVAAAMVARGPFGPQGRVPIYVPGDAGTRAIEARARLAGHSPRHRDAEPVAQPDQRGTDQHGRRRRELRTLVDLPGVADFHEARHEEHRQAVTRPSGSRPRSAATPRRCRRTPARAGPARSRCAAISGGSVSQSKSGAARGERERREREEHERGRRPERRIAERIALAAVMHAAR